MDREEIKPMGLFGWGVVLAVVYAMAPFIWIIEWFKGEGK